MIHPGIRVVTATLVWLWLVFPASAQDGLLVGGRFLSASRNFGEVLGPGPAVSTSNVFGGGRYVLSSTIGGPDLSLFLGADSHASFPGVPPGTYFLRLRGGNEFGGGRPSTEIRVVVP